MSIPGVGGKPDSIVVGDFNGDGQPDVVTWNEGSPHLSVFLNNTPLPTPAIRALTLDTTTPLGGSQNVNATLTLTAPAPIGGALVTLSSSDPALTVPAIVTIPEGGTSAGIIMVTAPVPGPRKAWVIAQY